jgi:hypothetical protein
MTRSDQPEQADRLGLRRERQTFTSNAFSLTSDYRLATVDTQQFYRLATFSSERESTVAHTVGASAATTVAAANRVTIGYEYLNSATDDAGEIAGHRLTAAVSRQLSTLASAGVETSYSLRTQRNGEIRESFDSWTAGLFGGYALPERWSVTARVGISTLSAEDHRWIVSGSVDLVYRLSRGTVGLTAERGFSETFAGGENFGVVETQGVTATLSWQWTPRITSTGQVYWRDNESTGVAASRQAGTERVWGATAALTYQVLRWLAVAGDYSFTSQDGAIDGTARGGAGTVKEHRGRISLSASF